MNLSEVERAFAESKKTKQADMLEAIFERQAAYGTLASHNVPWNLDYSRPLSALDKQRLAAWVKEFGLCLMMEASELIDWTPWKHWSSQLGNKNTQHSVGQFSPGHVEEMRVEVADLLCFLVNAARVLGMTAQDLHDHHEKKVAVNIERAQSGRY